MLTLSAILMFILAAWVARWVALHFGPLAVA